MIEGPYMVRFLFETVSDTLVDDVITICTAHGLYDKERNEGDQKASMPDEIRKNKRGFIRLHYEDLSFKLSFDLESGGGHSWTEGSFNISTQSQVVNYTDKDDPKYRRFIEELVGLVSELASATRPTHVHAFGTQSSTNEFARGVIPQELPVAHDISNLPWLGVYNPETVDALGGIDRFTDAPAHRVERLETGHVMVVATEDPFAVPDRELEEYLLQNENR
ncbi:hypothetical protein [Halosimplex pelagicum]|uniref:Uncharacterized protein n=1 Tax=Halosimplex pelagicum TaxID=869886 RepID=A0A7D5TR18_9EURY|nr:hypothetical protein [Halosimplex pelagicum]QLH80892.1 hypothetical protein HZS54_04220 [Halosimplex pelagicum]